MKVNLAYFFIILLLPWHLSAEVKPHTPSLSTISQLAIGIIEDNIDVPPHAKVSITPQNLDTRLSPPLCIGPVNAELATTRAIKRNNTIKISCETPQMAYPWQIFISVRVDILYPVVVATETLGPGDVISSSAVGIEYIEQSQLRGQQFDDTALVVGTRVKRRISMNQPLFTDNLCFVCKGDTVSIYAKTANFEIKTVGEALRDGNLGDRIRIRNSHSNIKVNARVIGVGEVEVRM